MMTDDQKIKLFYDTFKRNPHARVGRVIQRINRLEKAEALRQREPELPHPLAVIRMIRRLTWIKNGKTWRSVV